MKTVSFALAGLAILASVATAQKQVPVKSVNGVVKMATASQPKSTSAVVYSNTLSTGYYSTPGVGEEWVDWGSTRAGLEDHTTIIYGTLGYATTAPVASGPSLVWKTYDGYTGGCLSLSPGGLAVSVTGLPGTIFTNGATGWTVGIDFLANGLCFALQGDFGYSFSYSLTGSGPLLNSGDSAANVFDWIKASTGSCSPGYWFGGSPWAGFTTEFIGWKTSTNAGLGNDPTLSLSITGNSCPGGGIVVSIASTPPAAFSAVGIGIFIGAGIGGPLPGGAVWDVGLGPGVPPVAAILGLFPGTVSFPASTPAGAASGTVFAAQWVQKIGPSVFTSNVATLNVP